MTSTRDTNRLPGGIPGLFVVLVFVAGAVTACGEGAADTPEGPLPSDLSALSDRFWDAYLSWNPLQATYLGANRLNDRVRDISPSGRTNRRREVGALIDALAAINFPTLPPGERLTWLALDHPVSYTHLTLPTKRIV